MKLIIDAEPKEIAALVVALQKRQSHMSTADVVKEITNQLQKTQSRSHHC